jgi:NTE family protein
MLLTRRYKKLNLETVLVLQGGGSLGAYECGVYKCLYKNGIKFDVLAGSSIGAINTSIITAAQNADKDVPSILEDFWLALSENVMLSNYVVSLPYLSSDKIRTILSSLYSVYYGNPNAFLPKWFMPGSPDYFLPHRWTYLYDTAPLKKTLKHYIDFEMLKKIGLDKNSEKYSRLIITSTDIQKGEPVIFDTAHMDIDVDKIVACAGYPFYGIRWTEKDGRYLWDGSLLTNTPMMEVMRASPVINKKFYIVDVFPRQQKEIPNDMVGVFHRARDIIFMDKTDKNVEMLKVNEKYLDLLKRIYSIINSDDAKIDPKTKEKLKELSNEYDSLNEKYGAAITDVIRIDKKEDSLHYLYEDADFSTYRIKKLISQGEKDAEKAIARKKEKEKKVEI